MLKKIAQTFDCTVVGDVVIDLTFFNGDFSKLSYGGTSYCDVASIKLGGSGNVAVGLSLLGGRVAFVGKSGYDSFGKLYIEDLKEKKITSRIFLSRGCLTGIVIVLVDDHKERSFLVFRGANDTFSLNDIQKAANLIKNSKYVYFTGYSLVNEPQKSAILQGIKMSKKYGVKIVFDPGTYNLIQSRQDLFWKILNLCNVLSLNINEALAITNCTNIKNAIKAIKAIKVPLVALKCGEKGCILIDNNKKIIIKVPGIKVECIDPTGAGDAFTAALIYGLAHGLPLKDTGKLANWFAARVVTRIGPRCFPSKSEINNFLGVLTEQQMVTK